MPIIFWLHLIQLFKLFLYEDKFFRAVRHAQKHFNFQCKVSLLFLCGCFSYMNGNTVVQWQPSVLSISYNLLTCYIIMCCREFSVWHPTQLHAKSMESNPLTCSLSFKNKLTFPQHGTPFPIEVHLREIKISVCLNGESYVTANASLITSSVHLAHRHVTPALSPAEICSWLWHFPWSAPLCCCPGFTSHLFKCFTQW